MNEETNDLGILMNKAIKVPEGTYYLRITQSSYIHATLGYTEYRVQFANWEYDQSARSHDGYTNSTSARAGSNVVESERSPNSTTASNCTMKQMSAIAYVRYPPNHWETNVQ
jgi:hypothetical protein